jgi:hypothetical protein
MALDVDQLCGAGAHERSAGRIVSVAAIVAVAVNLPSRQIAAQSPAG